MAEPAEVILLKGALGQVAVENIAVFVAELEGKGLLDEDELQLRGLKAERLFILRAGNIQRLDPPALPLKEGIEAVGPGGGDEGVGRLVELAVKVDADADHIVRQKDQHHIRGIRMQQPAVFGFFTGDQFVYQHRTILSESVECGELRVELWCRCATISICPRRGHLNSKLHSPNSKLIYIPIRSKSSKLTVSVTSFFGLGYLTSTARFDWL